MPSSLDRTLVVRKLRPDEGDLYRDFLLRLDPQTRRDRFCSGVSDAYIHEHVGRVVASGALLYGCFHDDDLCGAAELHSGGPAEAAFAVARDCQDHGIGTALLEAVVLAARNRGHLVIRVTCLRTNEAMRRLAQKADARLILSYDEAEGEIRTPAPTALSWLREAVVDALNRVICTLRRPLKAAQAA